MSADTLIRHSERALRKPCSRCGRSGLYWAHDPDRVGRFTCEKDQCKVNGSPNGGRLVLAERDGTRHACGPGGAAPVPTAAAQPATAPAAAGCGCPPGGHHRTSEAGCLAATCDQPDAHPDWCHLTHRPDHDATEAWQDYLRSIATGVPPVPTVHTPDAPPAYAPPGDDAAALAELLARLTRSQVDRAEVEGWAREAIRSTESELRSAIEKATAAIHVPTVVKVSTDGGAPVDLPGTHHKLLPKLIAALSRGRHVMLVGPAGSGKSHMAHAAAEALGLPFGKIAFTPDTSAAAMVGYLDANGRYNGTQYRQVYDASGDGGVYCCDEIDNGHPSILTVMNDGLSNGSMAFADRMVARHPSFRCVATANTYGRGPDRKYAGRMPIDAATRNRFVVLEVGYDLALEDAMAAATGYDRWQHVTYVVRELRERLDAHAVNHIVGPRQVVDVCQLLQTDEWSWADAVESCFRVGLSDQDWAKVSAGVNLAGPR